MGDSIFERQPEILMTEAVTVNSPSHAEDFDDIGCYADLYVIYAFKQGALQGYSYTTTTSNHERSQQLTCPYCFQPLSLD